MSRYTDDEIIEKLQSPNKKHNDEALDYLYEHCYAYVAGLVLKNSGEKRDVEDTFQDAIIVFYNQVKEGKLTLTVSVQTYLYSIARNLWFKVLRQQKIQIPLTEEHEFIAMEEDSLEAELEFDEMTRVIQTQIEHLGTECQQVLRYFYLQKMRIKEIMALMNFNSVQSVKNKKARCIQKLKDKLRQNHLFDDFF